MYFSIVSRPYFTAPRSPWAPGSRWKLTAKLTHPPRSRKLWDQFLQEFYWFLAVLYPVVKAQCWPEWSWFGLAPIKNLVQVPFCWVYHLQGIKGAQRNPSHLVRQCILGPGLVAIGMEILDPAQNLLVWSVEGETWYIDIPGQGTGSGVANPEFDDRLLRKALYM